MRIKSIIISLLLLITIFESALPHLTAGAETAEIISTQPGKTAAETRLSNGVFSYYIYNGFAVIEKCLDKTSGIIIIPEKIGNYKVSKIKDGAFSLCPKIKGFISKNPRFTVKNGVLYNQNTLICYPPSKSQKVFFIPPHITKISDCAFFGNPSLEYISVPGSIEILSTEGFADCSALKTVVLNEGTTAISDGAFTFCSSLEKINLPKSVKSIGDAAFYGCSALLKLELSDNIEKIGKIAFQNCDSLTEIYIPKSTVNLSEWLFSIGKNLKSVKISPENTDFIEKNGVIYSENGETLTFCPQNAEVKDFAVPSGVKAIGENAFTENRNIKSLILSDSVEKIEDGAFYQAKNLSKVTTSDNLKEIGEYAFFGCESLGGTTLYTPLEKINEGAFEGCPNITLLAANGSAAYFYSRENNIPFKIDGTQPAVEIEKWSQGYINWAESNGITSGITDYTVTLNYEGLCWLLVNMYESVKGSIEITVENPFTDSESHAAIKAYQLGLIEDNENGHFRGTEEVSRQWICAEIYNLLKLINGKALSSGVENDFRDSSEIAEWAKHYVNIAYNHGIINGLPDGRINPNGNASIEAALGMLYNASFLIEK